MKHSDRLWKQLVLTGGPDKPAKLGSHRDLLIMAGCGAAAAAAIKIPAALGLDLNDDADFYQRNFSLFALVPLAAYFVWRRRIRPVVIGLLALLFTVGAVGANAYPLKENSQSFVLTSIHLPLALWLVVGVAYIAGGWRSDRKRMDFIRFTGEWVIYFVLMALGVGVLIAFTAGTFDAIGLDASNFIEFWLLRGQATQLRAGPGEHRSRIEIGAGERGDFVPRRR